MRAVLDEYGWTDPHERRAIRKIWRSLYAEESAVREASRKAAKAKKKGGERTVRPVSSRT